MKKIFPKWPENTPPKITKDLIPAVTIYEQASYIADILYCYYDEKQLKTKIITDANGGAGGNSISFAKVCKHINIVEIDNLHHEIINHNMKVYNIDNCDIFNKNYIEIIKKLEQDIVYIDPPWGGVDYKNKNKLNISYEYMDNTYSIFKIVDILSSRCDVLMLKLPINADISQFYNTEFKYVYKVDIIDINNIPIYTIIILSNIKRRKNIYRMYFERLKYRQVLKNLDIGNTE